MSFLHLIAQFRSPIADKIFSVLTSFGEEGIMILIVCLIYWCIDKKLAYRTGFAFFISGVIIQILKLSLRIERPWIIDPSFEAVSSAIANATGYSFPSGHTQAAAAIYLTLALNSSKNFLKGLFIILTAAVAFSRMYLGVHTPSDVIVSLTITAAVVIIIHFKLTLLNF